MKRCPWCGAEMKHGSNACSACDKGSAAKEDRDALISRDAFEKKTIPTWLFAIIVGIFLIGLALIFIR